MMDDLKARDNVVTDYSELSRQRTAGVRARSTKLDNETSELDRSIVRLVGEEISNNPVASRAYRQIQEQGVKIHFDFIIPGNKELGVYEGGFGKITIFANNHVGRKGLTQVKEIVETIVHEGNHVKRYALGRPIGTASDELRSIKREFLYREGRRPNKNELKELREETKARYPELFD